MQSLFPAPHTEQATASKPVTEQPTATQPVAKVEPAPPISSSPFDKLGSDHKTEFKHIFSPKEPQLRQADFAESSRDIPLQSLLESIALCR
ncbi:Uncharacterised protein [Yersinia enterocolitica]|jgi:hypothetical protein|nr:Uncharacterised protein [Yersinia enterocolitica]